jgi:hypothetical protein
MTLVKRHNTVMFPSDIIKILHLVYPNNPVFACKGFFKGVKLRALSREAGTADAILGLTAREKPVEIVIGHLVPVTPGSAK